MLEIISTGKNTQWHSFPNFHTKYSYSHINNEPVDFQVLPGKNIFLEINKKYGFELMRTYNKDGNDILQRVKKCQLDDLICGATTKTNTSEVALGLSTGFIRMFNISTSKFISSKLSPDKVGNSVIGLDYSNCDEYLAGLYESGDINVFGLKTGVKTNTFRLDGNSTVIRFHPTKRFHLAAASYLGTVTIYDIQSKRAIFQEKAAHSAPCRDVSMSMASPDIIFSCGYDCKINVYDSRKRTLVQQANNPYPLACVSVSPCGNFLCTGNLKGDITSFDFRNLKEPLDSKRVHEAGVIRVSFIPSLTDINNSDKVHSYSTVVQDNTRLSLAEAPAVARTPSITEDLADSFHHFIDVCRVKNESNEKSVSSKRRDSWLHFGGNKVTDDSLESIASTSHASPSNDNLMQLRLKRSVGRLSIGEGALPRPMIAICEETTESVKISEPKRPKTIENDINSKSDTDDVDLERRESVCNFKIGETLRPPMLSNNKENQQSNYQELFSSYLKDGHISTPNSNHQENKIRPEYTSIGLSRGGTESLKQAMGDIISQKLTTLQVTINSRLDEMEENHVNKINELEERLNKRVHAAENEIKFYQDSYHHSGFSDQFKLFKLMEKETDCLKQGMLMLLRSDGFVAEHYRLKAENEELKKQLEKYNEFGK